MQKSIDRFNLGIIKTGESTIEKSIGWVIRLSTFQDKDGIEKTNSENRIRSGFNTVRSTVADSNLNNF